MRSLRLPFGGTRTRCGHSGATVLLVYHPPFWIILCIFERRVHYTSPCRSSQCRSLRDSLPAHGIIWCTICTFIRAFSEDMSLLKHHVANVFVAKCDGSRVNLGRIAGSKSGIRFWPSWSVTEAAGASDAVPLEYGWPTRQRRKRRRLRHRV